MLKVIGYILMFIGFVGWGYFKSYKGEIIHYTFLWSMLCAGIGFLGSWLVFFKKKKAEKFEAAAERERIEHLKQNGEKIVLTHDNCRVLYNEYTVEIPASSNRTQSWDALYDESRTAKTENVYKTSIVYEYKTPNGNIKMLSPIYDDQAINIQSNIELGNICLYVDRFNKNNYCFTKQD